MGSAAPDCRSPWCWKLQALWMLTWGNPRLWGASPHSRRGEVAPARWEVHAAPSLPTESPQPWLSLPSRTSRSSPSVSRGSGAVSLLTQCSPGSPGTLGVSVGMNASMLASRGEHGVRSEGHWMLSPPHDEQPVPENSLTATVQTTMYHHCRTVLGWGSSVYPLALPLTS